MSHTAVPAAAEVSTLTSTKSPWRKEVEEIFEKYGMELTPEDKPVDTSYLVRMYEVETKDELKTIISAKHPAIQGFKERAVARMFVELTKNELFCSADFYDRLRYEAAVAGYKIQPSIVGGIFNGLQNPATGIFVKVNRTGRTGRAGGKVKAYALTKMISQTVG